MKIGRILGIGCVAILVVAGMVAAGCAPTPTPTPTPESKVFQLKLCTQHPPEDPMNKLNEAWGRWLERESEGRIKLTLLPAAQAAAPPDLYDAARTGIVDIVCHMPGFTPGRFPLGDVMELPLIFEWPASKTAALTAMALYEKYPEIQAQYPDVKVLNFHAAGPQQIHTIKKPVHTLEDMKGLVLLSFGSYMAAATAALGATPEMMGLEEIYDSLAKGVVDGVAVNWSAHNVFHWYEVTDYTTVANLNLTVFVHVMNLDTWNSLPPDLQELFVGENAWRLSELLGYQFDENSFVFKAALEEEYARRGLPEIYVLPEAEKARWVEAIMPVREKWISDAETLGAPGRAILEDALGFAEQYKYTGFSQECEDTLHEWGVPGY